MNCPLAMLRILPSRSPTWKRHAGTCRLTTLQSWVGRALAVTVFYRCTSATLMAISWSSLFGRSNMKPPRFRYFATQSVEEALTLLAEHAEEARVLAGGQSLVP